MITFSEGGAAKIKSKQFSEFGSQTTALKTLNIYTVFQLKRNVSFSSNWVHVPLPGNPEIFLSKRIPATRQFFCLIPLPRSKNDGRIPVGGAKFSQTRRNCSLSLQRILKKTTRQYKFFYLGSLTKPLYFKLKQNHSEVLPPTLIFNDYVHT